MATKIKLAAETAEAPKTALKTGPVSKPSKRQLFRKEARIQATYAA